MVDYEMYNIVTVKVKVILVLQKDDCTIIYHTHRELKI